MTDAADQVVKDDEKAMARFEEEQRQRRIAESMRGYDPARPVNCVECAEVIPLERLAAYPHTRRCQPCASEVELSGRNRWPQ